MPRSRVSPAERRDASARSPRDSGPATAESSGAARSSRGPATGGLSAPADSGIAGTIATIVLAVGLLTGLALAFLPAFGQPSGTPGLAAGSLVSAVLTAVVVRRGFAGGWKDAAVTGLVAGGVMFGSATGPGWPPGWPQALAAYALAVAGAAAILLTVPVRRLSGLPLEYAVVVLVALAGGGAATAFLAGQPLTTGAAGASLIGALGLALGAAARARIRLTTSRPSTGEQIFYGLVVAGVLVAVAAAGVIVVERGHTLIDELSAGLRPLIVFPLALLGPGVAARMWTASAWWSCGTASVGAGAIAVTFGVNGSNGAATGIEAATSAALSIILAVLIGLALTVVAAVGMRMLLSSPRRHRPARPLTPENGRLSVLS